MASEPSGLRRRQRPSAAQKGANCEGGGDAAAQYGDGEQPACPSQSSGAADAAAEAEAGAGVDAAELPLSALRHENDELRQAMREMRAALSLLREGSERNHRELADAEDHALACLGVPQELRRDAVDNLASSVSERSGAMSSTSAHVSGRMSSRRGSTIGRLEGKSQNSFNSKGGTSQGSSFSSIFSTRSRSRTRSKVGPSGSETGSDSSDRVAEGSPESGEATFGGGGVDACRLTVADVVRQTEDELLMDVLATSDEARAGTMKVEYVASLAGVSK